MPGISRRSATVAWINDNLKFASEAEMARTQLSHPSAQRLQTALELLGQVSQDQSWISDHDPGRKLVQAMEIIVQLTTIKSAGRSSARWRVVAG
jgi:hypothetical protein